ncbi:MAG: MBL fold metallo-hydrolase [Syntrophales bacterium]|nr:MBL fold metallo-hydrolase [Syntrophales bacterium]
MKITFLGAARKVTGSCFHLSVNGQQFLVDCGMHQGLDSDALNRKPFAFDPKAIGVVFLTHAHIDHTGLVPRLVREGFRGKIVTTAATAELARVMLADSAHIQEMDARWMTKKNLRAGIEKPVEPLYTVEDAIASIPFFEKKQYGETYAIDGVIRYRFCDAGHILGSGTLELWYRDDPEKKIIFSGDIGKKGNPIIRDPVHAAQADYVVVESTYGNRLHKGAEDSLEELADAVRTTFKRGGNVYIPAFAVGRTQDLLYIFNKLVREGRLASPLDIYIDSPLADEATKVYFSHPELFDEDAKRLFGKKKGKAVRVHFTSSVQESMKLNQVTSGAIIMAGSGMCEGGRIRHHLKHNLWRPECSVVFVGFQARGTLGRAIVDGAKEVWILGDKVAIRSRVFTIGGFSAHADQKELLEWLGLFKNSPEVFIVHGEEASALEFEKKVKETFGFVTKVPAMGDTVEL